MVRGLCCVAVLWVVANEQASAAAPPVVVLDYPWEPQYISRAEVLELALRHCGRGTGSSPSASANTLLRDVETAYWRLYGAYCQLFFRELAVWTISRTCRLAQFRYEAGLLKATGFAEPRRYFERYRKERLEAIRTIEEQDGRLRSLLGMSRPSHVRLAPDDLPLLPRSEEFQTCRAQRQALSRELHELLEAYRGGKGNDHHAVVEAQTACTEALSAEYQEIADFNNREVERAFARETIEARARDAIAGRLPRSAAPEDPSERYRTVSQEILDSGSLPRMIHYHALPQNPSRLFLVPGVSAESYGDPLEIRR